MELEGGGRGGGRGLAWNLGIEHGAGRALQLSGPDGRGSRARREGGIGLGETDSETVTRGSAGATRVLRALRAWYRRATFMTHASGQVLRGREPEFGVLRRPQPPQRGTVGGSRGGPPHNSCSYHAAAVRA